MDKIQVLSLNDDTFEIMKDDFDNILGKTIFNMTQKEGNMAEITLKLKVTLSKAKVRDFNYVEDSPEAYREVLIPRFQHKLSSLQQVKASAEGMLTGNFELVYDIEKGCYVMKGLNNDDQMTWDDYKQDFEDEEREDSTNNKKQLLVKGEDNQLLEG